MRVLHLIGSSGLYGAETVVTTLVRQLRAKGIDSCIGHIRYAGPDALKLEEHLSDCEVFPLLHRGRFDRRILTQLRHEIQRRKIDVVHCHGYKPDLYGWIGARFAHIPVISTCHLWTRATRALRLYAVIDGWILRHFDRVVGVSDPIVADLKSAGVEDQALLCIPNGITMGSYATVLPAYRKLFPCDAHIFGAACRQVKAKGVDILLRAMARVAPLVPRARLLIAGSGPFIDEYRHLARELEIADKVVFLGHVQSMPGFYASLDTFVLSSLDEGLPMALLEAMASARVVIATDVGSVKSLVRNEETGILIPPGNLTALTSAMLSVTSNYERLSHLGAAARWHVRVYYSDTRMTQRYADVYQQMCNADRGPR